jgi:hypothetical protein
MYGLRSSAALRAATVANATPAPRASLLPDYDAGSYGTLKDLRNPALLVVGVNLDMPSRSGHSEIQERQEPPALIAHVGDARARVGYRTDDHMVQLQPRKVFRSSDGYASSRVPQGVNVITA